MVVVGILAILVGLVGVVVPVMPGLLVVWGGTAGTLLLHRSDAVGWGVAAVLTVCFALGSVATIVLPARKGRQGGASATTFAFAALGAVAGFFLVPVIGFLLGAVVGLLVGERRRLGGWSEARTSTLRVLRAYGVGVVVELVLGVTMAVIWGLTVVLGG